MVRQVAGSSNYCALVKEGLDNVPWLKRESPIKGKSIEKCISCFEKHRKLRCGCTLPASDLLILASAYYQYYILTINDFQSSVDQVEESIENKQGHYLIPSLVNEFRETKILAPLKNCLRVLVEALVPGFNPKIKLLETIKVPEIIKCCFYIFSCHRIGKYQILCADLLVKYHQSCKDLEVTDAYLELHLLMGYHFYIQSYLDLGLFDRAQKKFQQAKVFYEKIRGTRSLKDHVEFFWLRIDELELALRSNKQELVDLGLRDLEILVKSPPLEQRRATRICLKLRVYFLLSQLPSSFTFFKKFEEFIDSHSLILTCLSTWHKSLWSSKPVCEHEKDQRSVSMSSLEENSVRYSIYDLSLRAFQSIRQFHIDVGSGSELQTTFKVLLAISRENCFLQW